MSEAYDLKKIKKKLKNELDESRYEHTIGVMDTAACLAMRYGADLTQALVAGLLHDCAKCIPNDKKLKLCRKNGIEVTPFEEKAPFLLHAKLGAWMAEHEYHVSDPAILSAIACHTTGKTDMSLLDKIVFIADYIEPGRNKAPGLPEIRRLSFTDIDQAVCEILKQTLDYLRDQGGEIDPATEVTYSYYLQKCAEDAES